MKIGPFGKASETQIEKASQLAAAFNKEVSAFRKMSDIVHLTALETQLGGNDPVFKLSDKELKALSAAMKEKVSHLRKAFQETTAEMRTKLLDQNLQSLTNALKSLETAAKKLQEAGKKADIDFGAMIQEAKTAIADLRLSIETVQKSPKATISPTEKKRLESCVKTMEKVKTLALRIS